MTYFTTLDSEIDTYESTIDYCDVMIATSLDADEEDYWEGKRARAVNIQALNFAIKEGF